METAKQKAIREAYKALGINIPEHSDENGWIGVSVLQLAHVQDAFIETKTDGKTLFGRPILLEGLEENNGWITIESEADLPKETATYHVVYKDGTIIQHHFSVSSDFDRVLFIEEFTHYQPILKPLKPVY